jgi:hypothetical protein
MIKLGNLEDMKALKTLPKELNDIIESILRNLDTNYGSDRNIDIDDGGYVLIVENERDIIECKDVDIREISPEYVEEIMIGNEFNYTNTLVIVNNEFAITIIINKEYTPKNILEYLR